MAATAARQSRYSRSIARTTKERLPRKISFVEALKEKYCTGDDDLETNGFVIEFVSKPKNDSEAELGYLRNVVLDRCRLSHLGFPTGGLAKLCPNIVDLDLSNNHLTCADCLTLLAELPRVKFFNISGNPLINCQGALEKWNRQLAGVENLVMNSTGISWRDIMLLCSYLPCLKELHVCENGYSEIELGNPKSLEGLECLRLNGNQIKRWEEIWKLHSLNQLRSLVLSKNPLENIFYHTSLGRKVTEREMKCNQLISEIEDFLCFTTEEAVNSVTERYKKKIQLDVKSGETCGSQHDVKIGDTEDSQQSTYHSCEKYEQNVSETQENCSNEVIPFQSLSVLCVSETQLDNWQHLEALVDFPSLSSVRLKGISLAKTVPEEDRRKLFIASLPNIQFLNSSEVTCTERDKAERHFVRFFLEQDNQPTTFHKLRDKHGKMDQLVDVDIGFGFQEWAEMDILYNGQHVQRTRVHVTEPVGKLRIYISKTIGLLLRHFLMFHNPCSEGHDREYVPGEERQLDELRLDSLPMSRYNFMDGDQIIVVDR